MSQIINSQIDDIIERLNALKGIVNDNYPGKSEPIPELDESESMQQFPMGVPVQKGRYTITRIPSTKGGKTKKNKRTNKKSKK